MKCFYHPDVDAVAQCIDCSKGLCQEDSAKFEIIICKNCNQKRLAMDKTNLVKNFVIMALLYIVGFYYSWKVAELSFLHSFMGAFIIAGIPWGWGFLTKITPNFFLFMPLIGWVIYFLVKVTIAYIIGWAVFIYRMVVLILQFVRANKVSSDIEKA